jgi:cytoplasmic iron level regulating protein YaaA (DUF328/UPF0246 family)
MKVLLSPAKSLKEQCDFIPPSTSVPFFEKESTLLANKLKKLSVAKLGKMMHLSDELAELNHNRYQEWYFPEPNAGLLTAILAFSGEVYRGFNAAEMKGDKLVQCNETVRILSGLYGILKPLDLIFPYRLEMGTKWKIGVKHPNLYAYWGSKLTDFLASELSDGEEVVNLASHEYSKAIRFKELNRTVITPVFKEFKNGTFKVVMMYAKHARGRMARYIVEENIKNVELLKHYQLDGYAFDVNQSTENEWVFVR